MSKKIIWPLVLLALSAAVGCSRDDQSASQQAADQYAKQLEKAEEQAQRYDRILSHIEAQNRRFDKILDAWEAQIARQNHSSDRATQRK